MFVLVFTYSMLIPPQGRASEVTTLNKATCMHRKRRTDAVYFSKVEIVVKSKDEQSEFLECGCKNCFSDGSLNTKLLDF